MNPGTDGKSEIAGESTKISYINGEPDSIHLRKVELVVHPGLDNRERSLTFDKDIIDIGSSPTGTDVKLDDNTVSRRHCRIIQKDENYLVKDLDSTNGTYVDGVRIKEAYLSPGVVLSIGNTQVRFSPFEERIEVTPSSADRCGDIVGRSPKIRKIFSLLEKIAPSGATAVIEGETGTGKEVVARTIHEMSPRRDESFVVFDCGAVPDNLIESELFGHKKGSFTGAVMSRKGVFEMAEGGTIFLDELGELSLDLQPKLLRVLEQREVRPVGANEPVPVNVRVVAATNRDLEDEVAAGRFREDLFYRLSVVRIVLPPLRERIEDIPLLVKHFLRDRDFNRTDDDSRLIESIDKQALDALEKYNWPGNVRELINVIERACSFAETKIITLDDLPDHVIDNDSPVELDTPSESNEKSRWSEVPDKANLGQKPFKEAKSEWIDNFEQDYILNTLMRHGGNISAAAREADIDRKYFRQLMDKHEIQAEDVD